VERHAKSEKRHASVIHETNFSARHSQAVPGAHIGVSGVQIASAAQFLHTRRAPTVPPAFLAMTNRSRSQLLRYHQRDAATTLRRNGPAPRCLRCRGGDVVAEESDPAASIDSSEFAQVLREFTDLLRGLRASDLSTSDRANLHSLLDLLDLLDLLTKLQAHPADPMRPPPESY
jgi:hypothetical protein